jgi:hypothetical protein
MPILTSIVNPKFLLLEFSEVWQALFKNISLACEFSIESLSPTDFNASFETAGERSFLIIITFSKTLVDKSLLTLRLNPLDEGDENTMFTLSKTTLELELDEYHLCETNKTWIKGFISLHMNRI